MKVFVEVDKGPSHGARFEIPPRSYRAIGRAGDKIVTAQLSEKGGCLLDPDDLKVVEAHLKTRPQTGGTGTEKSRIGTYKRGRDILIDDDQISRTHAIVFVDEDGPSVVDLLSTNGTLVNGKKVSDANLRSGDVINIGRTRFIIRAEFESATSTDR